MSGILNYYDNSEAEYLFLLLQDLNLSDGYCKRLIFEIEMGFASGCLKGEITVCIF